MTINPANEGGDVNFETVSTDEVGIIEQASAPSGESGVRKLYTKDSDGNIYKVNPDGTEEQVGGGGFTDEDSDGNTDTVPLDEGKITVSDTQPSSPSSGDIWIDNS